MILWSLCVLPQKRNHGLGRDLMTRMLAVCDLKNLPVVNSDLTYMVRQLQPTEKGIPLEVYFFSREKDWVPYEKIQADVFDHIFAVVPYFGLKVFQNPSSEDIVRVLERV